MNVAIYSEDEGPSVRSAKLVSHRACKRPSLTLLRLVFWDAIASVKGSVSSSLPMSSPVRSPHANSPTTCSTNPMFVHTKSIVAAARATTAAASAIIAKASSVGELHALHAATSALHSPRTSSAHTPRDTSRPFTGAPLTPRSSGNAVALPAAARLGSVAHEKHNGTDSSHSRERQRPTTSPTQETSSSSGSVTPVPGANSPPRGALEVFPAWIRERKDFQVFFPRFSDIVITDEEILRQGVPKDPADRNIVELQCLARWIMKIPSMATSLDLSQATEIAKLARYQSLKPREFVFRKGDKGDASYLVFTGEVHVLIDGQKVATVGKNSAFGDIALQIENATRGADVQAGFPTSFASQMPANIVTTTSSANTTPPSAPAIGAEVLKIMAEDYHKTLARCQTRRRKHLINWLHTEVLLFRDCVESKLHYFELVSLDVPLKQGEVLYRQGDSIGAFYVVRSGKVRLEVDIQYEHKHRWPVGTREWKEKVHAAKSRIPFSYEEQAGFFGFEMFVEGQQARAYTVIADSPTVELVGLNRVDCFSPYFSFTPRAIDRVLEKHDKCRELATKQIHQKLKDFHQLTSTQKKAFGGKELPVRVKAKFRHSKETPQFQFPSLKPAKWEATNDVVRALQLSCQ